MYGPTKGDIQFILGLAIIGAVASVIGFISFAVWVLSHISWH